MIARGKNASDLFPAVVKNVACKNIEVRKVLGVQVAPMVVWCLTCRRVLGMGWVLADTEVVPPPSPCR